MRIAVDLRPFFKNEINNYEDFICEVLIRLAQQHTQHQFLFFSDDFQWAKKKFTGNDWIIVASKAAIMPAWLRDFRLSGLLKKHKADIFISTNGICNLRTPVIQLMILPDMELLKYPVFTGRRRFFSKNRMVKYVGKAKMIATITEHSKQQLTDQFKVKPEKIQNIGIAASLHFTKAEWTEKEKIKEQYTSGCEYFIFTGGFALAGSLLNLLKAFTLFKARQRTNMKLVVAGMQKLADRNISEKLETYKLRNEIRVLDNLSAPEVANLVAGSYASVNPVLQGATGISVVEAMQCEVPVIVPDAGNFREIGGDAALYIDAEDPASIAEQLKVIFKDENLRNSLIQKGKLRISAYSWQKTTELLMQAIDQAVSN